MSTGKITKVIKASAWSVFEALQRQWKRSSDRVLLNATSADAKVKETQADEQIKVSRSAEFTANLGPAKAIGVRLKNLTTDQALALAKAMEPLIEKRSANLMNALDPSKERLKDGQKAKEVLFKWQVFDDRDRSSMKQWTDALVLLGV